MYICKMLVNNYIQMLTEIPAIGISAVLEMRSSGASIPFMARYRKERTGNLNEVEIESIFKAADIYTDITSRKTFILKTISDQNLLANELELKIKDCFDLNVLEDLYLPFKVKKRSKAEIAKKAGLLGLAKLIMSQKHKDINVLAKDFVKGELPSETAAIEGAQAIIESWIVENPLVREKIRKSFNNFSIITSEKIKTGIDEQEKYKNFYDFSQPIAKCPSYRLLAILRGEQEKILRIKIRPKSEFNISWLNRLYVKDINVGSELVKSAIINAYKKKIVPSLESETKTHFKVIADDKSILTFTKNLKQILLSPPIGSKRTLAIDPGFRTGCKVVCLSENGDLLHNTTIYPHPPQKEKSKAMAKISQLVEMYHIEAIAIGDGTAGRETEKLIKHIGFKKPPMAYMVREDGASIYSASKVAREEFPTYDVTVRGSVSIGRRLCDPLAELVKIDAKSLGIGQYQHDVNQIKLKAALDLTVETVVNMVGVNVNTASKYLLAYVSGIGPKLSESIVAYRSSTGAFKNRESLKKVPGLGEKAFEQAAGFLRIKNPVNPLDNSSVHPEQYKIVNTIAKNNHVSVLELIGNKTVLADILSDNKLIEKIGIFTLKDLVEELKKPGIDPRMKATIFKFSDDIGSISDLKIGMTVSGLVTNVTDFGAFVNIGIKTNGLIHKTEIAQEYVEHPTDFLAIDQQVKAKVILIDIERKRIGLSLK